MPLKSRATQNRADRAATPTDDAGIQPRANAKPATPEEAPAAAQEVPTDVPNILTPKARRTRKTATKRVVATPSADGGAEMSTKDIRARQRELEKEFKSLSAEEKKAVRALESDFRARRMSLESEHRLLAGQLSTRVFRG